MKQIIEKKLSYIITGLCFKVHNELGRFCKERQYADRLEQLLREQKISYKREFAIAKKDVPKGNCVDFFIEEKIIVELKAKQLHLKEDYYQLQRYLHCADIELGLLINFRDKYLKPKRVLNAAYSGYSGSLGDSDRVKGFSLIELTITIAIIGVLGMGLWNAWVIGLQVTTEKRAEVTATAIATEQVERMKTIPYAGLGTVGGIPAGSIPRETTIARNGITYTVQTAVFYIDDSFDGKTPQDSIPTDYKRIRVTVLWSGKFGVSPVVLMTDAAPKGLETNTGGGTLILRIADAARAPIPDAIVTIKNAAVTPPIDTVSQTIRGCLQYSMVSSRCDRDLQSMCR